MKKMVCENRSLTSFELECRKKWMWILYLQRKYFCGI
jgi:hypothetical protein